MGLVIQPEKQAGPSQHQELKDQQQGRPVAKDLLTDANYASTDPNHCVPHLFF